MANGQQLAANILKQFIDLLVFLCYLFVLRVDDILQYGDYRSAIRKRFSTDLDGGIVIGYYASSMGNSIRSSCNMNRSVIISFSSYQPSYRDSGKFLYYARYYRSTKLTFSVFAPKGRGGNAH